MQNHKLTGDNEMSSIPVHAPLYPPLLKKRFPYRCPNLSGLSVYCEANEKAVREILELTPFEFITNKFTISVSDFSNCTWMPFMDAAIIIPVKFRDVIGGYYAYEYEDHERAVIAGRELWGYPKKLAKITLALKNNHVLSSVEREGIRLVDISCDLKQTKKEIPLLPVYPHLLLQVIPKVEGPGVFLKRVIARDTSGVTKIMNKKYGDASVSLGKLESDPLYRLLPLKVLGATFTISDYKATWGKVLATIPSES
jgi:acetoacetate decarboxylase